MNAFKVGTLLVTALLTACAASPSKSPSTASPAPPAMAAKPAAAATNVSGAWVLNVETPMGARDMKMSATQTGETLTGTIGGPRGDTPIMGTVKGNAVAFAMKVNVQGADMTIEYAGTVEGDSMKGTAKFGEFGNGTFTGKKQ